MQSSNSGNFKGKHLFGELYNVSKIKLSDSALLTNILLEAIPLGNATICGIQVKSFEPTGVTILALLAESHACIHT